ncbi:paramyosin [Pseudozyma hubeiensis SY62]|uniref:Paramyosin n=1 Tax=Pseudozyma hubeiensis (strain SY62) TaxID=1305764 RepID=R9P8N7_PSEHS|nr:paramyosin [Pseudozyma hubeiensis SY62]GAC97709.1 paramyosin [Pseudozyma hubeiensis SY62]
MRVLTTLSFVRERRNARGPGAFGFASCHDSHRNSWIEWMVYRTTARRICVAAVSSRSCGKPGQRLTPSTRLSSISRRFITAYVQRRHRIHGPFLRSSAPLYVRRCFDSWVALPSRRSRYQHRPTDSAIRQSIVCSIPSQLDRFFLSTSSLLFPPSLLPAPFRYDIPTPAALTLLGRTISKPRQRAVSGRTRNHRATARIHSSGLGIEVFRPPPSSDPTSFIYTSRHLDIYCISASCRSLVGIYQRS